MSKNYSVSIVEDSITFRNFLKKIVNDLDHFEVTDIAKNGAQAIEKIKETIPDIILLDIQMPEMNGLEMLEKLQTLNLKYLPKIIIVSSLATNNAHITMEALKKGAVDFVKKPDLEMGEDLDLFIKDLNIKLIATSHIIEKSGFRSLNSTSNKLNIPIEEEEESHSKNTFKGISWLNNVLKEKKIDPEIVVISSSTGGPQALRTILSNLDDLPVPVIIGQHMPEGFTKGLAENLAHSFHKNVKEAQSAEILKPNTIYICPSSNHAKVNSINSRLVYLKDSRKYEKMYFTPSGDLLFSSVAKACQDNAIGIILSGMGKDGSLGITSLREHGSLTIAQDSESSVIWGMPGAAVKNGGIDIVLSANEIAQALNKIFK